MSLEQLTNTFNSLPQSSSDIRMICNALEGAYSVNKSQLESLYQASKLFKTQIILAFEYLDSESYESIIEGLTDIETEYVKLIEDNVIVDVVDVDMVQSIKNLDICTDLINNLPPSIVEMILSVEFGLQEAVNNLVPLPLDILSNTINLINEVKVKTIKDILGQNYTLIIDPLLTYESFLSSNEVTTIITSLEEIEMCLMNPLGCNKTRDNLMNKDTNLLWSQYFKEVMNINKKGKLQLEKFTSDKLKISQAKEILERSKTFLA